MEGPLCTMTRCFELSSCLGEYECGVFLTKLWLFGARKLKGFGDGRVNAKLHISACLCRR